MSEQLPICASYTCSKPKPKQNRKFCSQSCYSYMQRQKFRHTDPLQGHRIGRPKLYRHEEAYIKRIIEEYTELQPFTSKDIQIMFGRSRSMVYNILTFWRDEEHEYNDFELVSRKDLHNPLSILYFWRSKK